METYLPPAYFGKGEQHLRYTREVAGCPSICKELPVAEFFEYMASSLCLPAPFFGKSRLFYIMNAELNKIKSGSSAVILCGGKSTRMAQDKAGLLIGKKTLFTTDREKSKRRR